MIEQRTYKQQRRFKTCEMSRFGVDKQACGWYGLITPFAAK
jgi:hypothetical protein